MIDQLLTVLTAVMDIVFIGFGIYGFYVAHLWKNAAKKADELMEELRITGEVTGGPPPFSDRQRIAFINSLNKFLTQKRKS